MGDLGTDEGLASEFVRFLNLQLKESRDEVHRLKQENDSLKEKVAILESRGAAPHASPLQNELQCLIKERDAALALAAILQAEANTWKTRYEQLKPQLATSAALNAQLADTMRNELIAFVHGHSATFTSTASGGMHRWSDPAQTFHAFISGLPETATPDAQQLESRVVFRNVTKLPLLSKAAIKACIGGFAFFGDLLQWCAPLSQHALVVFPKYEFSPKPATGATTWTNSSTTWTSYAGQQRDLLYVDGGDISYAGTFFCHGGPRAVKLAELGYVGTPRPSHPRSRHEETKRSIEPDQDLCAVSHQSLPRRLSDSPGSRPTARRV